MPAWKSGWQPYAWLHRCGNHAQRGDSERATTKSPGRDADRTDGRVEGAAVSRLRAGQLDLTGPKGRAIVKRGNFESGFMKIYRNAGKGRDKPSFGDHLYGLRKQRKWTQGDLSKRSGVAVSTISKIENGQLSPSFETLLRVAEGLSMTITDLMTIDAEGQHTTRRAITRSGDGELHQTDAYDYELLCGDINNKIMHPLIARLKAGSITEFGELFSHPGEELLYVLEGEVELHTEHYKPMQLSVGDCAYFDSTMGHACISVGEEEAVIFWVSTIALIE